MENKETIKQVDKEPSVVGGAPKGKRVYKKIADMQGSQKILRIINVVFAFALALACYIWSIYRVVTLGFADPELRYLASFAVGTFALVPILLERIFRINVSNFVMLLFLGFLLFAGFIGSGIGMYPKWEKFYYDKIMHGIFGYVGAVAGLLILCKLSDHTKTNPVFAIIVCFSVSMACGAVWEIFEFASDRLLGATAQGIKVYEGYAIVRDTMQDILANFAGAVVFVAHYAAHAISRKNLGMGSMIKDFINN